MATFHKTILLLGRENLSDHELCFLAAHSVIIDHGLQMILRGEASSQSEHSGNAEDNLNQTISDSATGPIIKLENNSLSILLLPPIWKLTHTSKQAYSVEYTSPLSHLKEFQGPKDLSLKALVINNTIMFHLTESRNPENLISFDIKLSNIYLINLIKSLNTSPSPTESEYADCVYMMLYEKLHPHLNNVNDIGVLSKKDTDESLSSKMDSNPIQAPTTVPQRPRQIVIMSQTNNNSTHSDLVGPDDPLFRARSLGRGRRTPGFNFDPLDPISPLLLNNSEDDDDLSLPRIGWPRPHHL